MRYFQRKQIHSGFAGWSSRDIQVTKELSKLEFENHVGTERTVSDKHGFSIVYTGPDKKYYDLALAQRRCFDEVVSKEDLLQYAQETYVDHGWFLKDAFLDEALNKYWEDERLARIERRTQEGFIIPEWSNDIKPEQYQGGFSNKVFHHPALASYVNGGGCHGYIGHSVRKPDLDKFLEKQFLTVNPDVSLFAMWLTSTGGRHFGDSLEDASFAEQKAYIKKSVAGLIEQALGYREKESV